MIAEEEDRQRRPCDAGGRNSCELASISDGFGGCLYFQSFIESRNQIDTCTMKI